MSKIYPEMEYERCRKCTFAAGDVCLLKIYAQIEVKPDCPYLIERSEFDLSGDDVICPYCGGKSNHADHEVFSEGEHEITCPDCEMKFTVTLTYSIWCESEKIEESQMREKAYQDMHPKKEG